MESIPSKKPKLTIGRLAHATGLNITTVRYYQKRGLLRQPERPGSGGFRSYGPQDVERLLLIKQAQDLGFSLSEITDMVAYIAASDCRAVEALAAKKLKTVRGQIRLLEKLSKTLGALLADCPHECGADCPLVQKLNSLGPRAAEILERLPAQ